MQDNPSDRTRPSRQQRAHGVSLDGVHELAAAVEAVREHPGPVELPVGPDQLAGRHLGALPRRQMGEALREAGADPLLVRATVSLDDDIPDEGVIAVLDDHLSLAAGLGARFLVVPRAGVDNRGRSEERVYSMLAALAEAASAHGVHLLLETEGATEDELDLLGALERAREEGVLDVDDRYVASVAWNVGGSTGAGEDLAAAFQRMRPLLDRAPLVLRGLDEATLEALFAAVPDLEEAAAQRRVLVLLDGPGPAAG
ncbi:hypothetical protein AS188_07325 [Kocuria flava]|nr:hypothetical protein [Kocuria flava]ALU39592.1 hypothetical protein AS188_07325 [Kocuria flava]